MKVLGSYWMKNGFINDGPRIEFYSQQTLPGFCLFFSGTNRVIRIKMQRWHQFLSEVSSSVCTSDR